jgi:hypothetical protein
VSDKLQFVASRIDKLKLVGHSHHRAGFRLEFARWFVGVDFLSGREDEPNQPRHQPTEAPTTSSTTRTPTNASFNARRKTRRATNRKSATATKAIRPVVMAIVILPMVPEEVWKWVGT